MTPSRVPNILPRPRVSNIMKNSTDQRGEAGIFTMASVKAMNVRPGPDADYKKKKCTSIDLKAQNQVKRLG